MGAISLIQGIAKGVPEMVFLQPQRWRPPARNHCRAAAALGCVSAWAGQLNFTTYSQHEPERDILACEFASQAPWHATWKKHPPASAMK